MRVDENKQIICDKLLETLKETRQFWDLLELKYDAESEKVTAVYKNDYMEIVNVEADSGIAMIRDILRTLE